MAGLFVSTDVDNAHKIDIGRLGHRIAIYGGYEARDLGTDYKVGVKLFSLNLNALGNHARLLRWTGQLSTLYVLSEPKRGSK